VSQPVDEPATAPLHQVKFHELMIRAVMSESWPQVYGDLVEAMAGRPTLERRRQLELAERISPHVMAPASPEDDFDLQASSSLPIVDECSEPGHSLGGGCASCVPGYHESGDPEEDQ
jgi:hypothetical protein